MRVELGHTRGGVNLSIDGRSVRWEGEDIVGSGDLALTTTLLAAMVSGDDQLLVCSAVSTRLQRNAAALQAIFGKWLPNAHTVNVAVPAQASVSSAGGETACFFSGGVDSFHAVVSNRAEIDRLVYVDGFDVRSQQGLLRQRVHQSLRDAADALGIQLTVLSTDLRDWSDEFVAWPMYHGAALASAAHLLSGSVSRAIVPSSAPYDQLYPWGSHPLTDPLWSGTVEVEHRGAALDRFEKTEAIIDEPAAWRALRVCWRNPGQAYNCGMCEKCLRTMTTLAAFGVLERFETFPDTLTARRVAQLQLRGDAARRNARVNVRLLSERGERPDLARAWQRALAGPSLSQRGAGLGRRAFKSLKRRWRGTR